MGEPRMEGQVFIAVLLLACAVQFAYSQVNCTAAGRFADPADPTCQNYTLCVLDTSTNNTFLSYNYTCPTPSVFSPPTSQCSTAYTCPNTNSTAAANTTNITDCTAEGFIADTNSTDCSSYIQCVAVNGSFTETVLTCPAGTVYDPATTLCDPSYTCSTPFSCSASGRFPDPADPSCQQYYLCVPNTSGTFTAYQYTCPTSVFNPATSLCTAAYTCPTS